MSAFFCPTCTHRIHNKARLCLHCLADRNPSRLHIVPPSPRMPSLDARLLQTWAYPFQLIEKAGGADLPQWRALNWRERLVVVFNPWAMLLGPVYFIYLGLGKRAIAMTTVWLLLPSLALLFLNRALALFVGFRCALFDPFVGLQSARWLPWFALWCIAALAFAVRANRDFYRKLELEEGAALTRTPFGRA